jgi:phage terminase large subunit-like protein
VSGGKRRETRGQRVIRFIESYCHIPDGSKVGAPFLLERFQKRFILEIYDNRAGTSQAILSIARKNGKTALIACIVLAHLVGPESRRNSQIVSGAMSREQAAIVFDLAWKICQLSPRLLPIVRAQATHKILIGLPLGTTYQALSAEGKTAHGKSPVLAILDEVGQIRGPTDPFVEAITTAQGAHEDPLLIAISTQAPSDADMLSLWIDDYVRDGDPHTVCHVYTAPADCELLDRKAWRAANPALGSFRQLADLERQAGKATRIPAQEASFRNLCLNQRVALASMWLAPTVWKAGNGAIDPALFSSGRQVYLGLDLSARSDLTAAVASVLDDDGAVHLMPFVYTPLVGLEERGRQSRAPYPTWVAQGQLIAVPGATISYDFVAAHLRAATAGWNIASVEFDRWRLDLFREACARVGFEDVGMWHKVGQGFVDQSPRVDAFESALLAGKVRHGGHPLLAMGAANAISIADAAGNRKLDKSKSTQRIDPLVAGVMAAFPALPEGNLEHAIDVLAMVG